MPPKFYQEYEVVVLGGGSVGKSALKVQFVLNCFLDGYEPTIHKSYRKQVLIKDEIGFVEVLDTDIQDEYWPMSKQCGFLLVYSIADRNSFNKISPVYERILRLQDQNFGPMPVVIVGNKCDLEVERQVASSEGRDLAKHFGCQFLEASAKSRLNVDEIFVDLVLAIRQHNKGQRENRLTPLEVSNGPRRQEESKTASCCGSCVVL